MGRVRLAQISGRFAAVPAVSAVFGLGMPTSEILVDNLISEILYIARLDNDDDLLTTAGRGQRDSVKNLLPVASSLLHLTLIHLYLSLSTSFSLLSLAEKVIWLEECQISQSLCALYAYIIIYPPAEDSCFQALLFREKENEREGE